MEMKVWIQSAFFVIYVINVILGDIDKWIRSKPVTRCAGEDVETEFIYNDPTLSMKNYTSITWTFRSKKNPKVKAIYIGYYTGVKKEFKLAESNLAKYADRVKWVNKTFNIQLKNLSSDDSGWYDMSFTVFGAGTIRSALDNSSFLLDVNDPCVKPSALSEGCTQLTCSTQTSSPKYSWSGDAAGQTTPTVKVCPKNEMNYTCCIDEEKNSCTNFLVSPGEFKNMDSDCEFKNMDSDSDQEGDNDKIHVGVIIGIVAGCVVFVAIIGGVCLYCRRKGGYSAASTKDRIL